MENVLKLLILLFLSFHATGMENNETELANNATVSPENSIVAEETLAEENERQDFSNGNGIVQLNIFFAAINTSIVDLRTRVEKLEADVESFRSNITEEIEALKDRVHKRNASNGEALKTTVAPPIDLPEQRPNEPDQQWLDNMLKNPKVRLYTGENQTGDSQEYHLDTTSPRHGGCRKVEYLHWQWQSVYTYGHCARLFAGYNCDGWSLAAYPGSRNQHNILHYKLIKVRSVGPCLPNEFQFATFQTPLRQNIIKNYSTLRYYVPDLVEFYNRDKHYKAPRVNVLSHSLGNYLMGPRNRVEFLGAYILPGHLNRSLALTRVEENDFLQSLETEDSDVVGYGIPPSLGGPVDHGLNLFAQAPAGKEEWARLTDRIRANFEENNFKHAVLAVTFLYENDLKTRPYAFYYYVFCGGNGEKILYGRVLN